MFPNIHQWRQLAGDWLLWKVEIWLSLSQEIQSTEDYSKGINMVSEKKIGRCKIDPGVPLCS